MADLHAYGVVWRLAAERPEARFQHRISERQLPDIGPRDKRDALLHPQEGGLHLSWVPAGISDEVVCSSTARQNQSVT